MTPTDEDDELELPVGVPLHHWEPEACPKVAPTEILADQHFRKIAGWMTPLGVRVVWLTGSLKKKDKVELKTLF